MLFFERHALSMCPLNRIYLYQLLKEKNKYFTAFIIIYATGACATGEDKVKAEKS